MARIKDKLEFWTKEENLQKIQDWVFAGLTNQQIAENLDIALSTFYEWCKKSTEFSNALKTTKDVADIQVENALYKKALGYTVRLAKTFKVKEEFFNENGKKIKTEEKLVTGYDEQHIPADTIAQIFWLKNRKPNDWREKVVAEVNGDGMVKDILAYMEKNKNE